MLQVCSDKRRDHAYFARVLRTGLFNRLNKRQHFCGDINHSIQRNNVSQTLPNFQCVNHKNSIASSWKIVVLD